jgi:hypothetical protein
MKTVGLGVLLVLGYCYSTAVYTQLYSSRSTVYTDHAVIRKTSELMMGGGLPGPAGKHRQRAARRAHSPIRTPSYCVHSNIGHYAGKSYPDRMSEIMGQNNLYELSSGPDQPDGQILTGRVILVAIADHHTSSYEPVQQRTPCLTMQRPTPSRRPDQRIITCIYSREHRVHE